MRVITGKYKGRRIMSPLNDNVRPTTDKVKEAMFAALQTKTEDAVVVDLFAGTGGLGIEALSRGARKVYFCDGASASIELIKQNASFLEKGTYEILRGDFSDCIRRLASRGVKADIVLCDPPYGKGLPEKALSELQNVDLVKHGGTVAVERRAEDKPQRKCYAFKSTHTFGDTCVDFLENASFCAVTGTFDPFTLGHKYVVEKALEAYEFCYVVMMVNENKTAKYSVKTRLRMAEISLKEYKNRIRIEYYEGMAADYMTENGIECIYRGARNEKDEAYEREMAEFNKTRCGAETVIVRAVTDISATEVKEMFERGESVAELVADGVSGLMRKR